MRQLFCWQQLPATKLLHVWPGQHSYHELYTHVLWAAENKLYYTIQYTEQNLTAQCQQEVTYMHYAIS